jgi:hypothetical protein
MLDYVEYTIEDESYQGNGHHHNGYDHLEGDWLDYYKVGKNFTHKVKPEDREDFLHDLFLSFARVKTSYNAKGKELTTGGLVRIAQYEVADYWRKWYRRKQNSDCGGCSKKQRKECEANSSYGSKCPKAIQLESLDMLVEDGEGYKTELNQLLADDNADFIPRLEAKLVVEAYPVRFVQLAYKKYAGYSFTDSERNYFYRELKKAQKSLV